MIMILIKNARHCCVDLRKVISVLIIIPARRGEEPPPLKKEAVRRSIEKPDRGVVEARKMSSPT